MLFLLACIHQVTSCRAGWIFHPSTSSGSFSSSKQAAPYMQARITHAYPFYLGIDYFDFYCLRPVQTVSVKCSGIGCFVCCLRKMQRVRNDSIYCILYSKLRSSELGFKYIWSSFYYFHSFPMSMTNIVFNR